jgi:glutamine synthetase|tara:strand:- start:682 stop:1692 length:1011 start_codon:yes stop_codon:yes gene_type:complete
MENEKRIRVEYVWLDGDPILPRLRSKTRYVDNSLPVEGGWDWNFDGGSTNQGSLSDSDRLLTVERTYKDPFHEGGFIALCEVAHHSGYAHETNSRKDLADCEVDGVLVGFEQEFTFINPADGKPLGMLLSPTEQGQYYCGVGCTNAIGRSILYEFEKACEKAGVALDGINAEVMPGQWEFQTAPQNPLKAADDMWVGRYLLDRISETKPLIISYDPKPHPEFNGAGCHTNISTEKMRDTFGMDEQEELMVHLEIDHPEHIKVCGDGIERRMTGECETSDYKTFCWGVGDRGASIRIPQRVAMEGAGYFEDRRPCANIDPYKVLYSLIGSLLKAKLL